MSPNQFGLSIIAANTDSAVQQYRHRCTMCVLGLHNRERNQRKIGLPHRFLRSVTP